MDYEGQWCFRNQMNTIQVPCPACGAAPGEPCLDRSGRPIVAGLLHGSRLCEIVETLHNPTGHSSDNDGSI